MRRALTSVPGVGEISIEAGDPDFTVAYDSTKLKPADIVAKLQAAGETGARHKT